VDKWTDGRPAGDGEGVAVPNEFPWWVIATHFLNIVFMLLLARSGIEVLSAFPKLYWNDGCPPGVGRRAG
jgi:hypothetical protein